ncbi:MAG: HEPN domain-containing protein [Bacteroidales bacterium]|nr:HEPN domain-containing protein [Bacteroidales bacterium]
MTPEERKAIVEYRLEKCHNTLANVRRLFDLEMYAECANRMYYAVYYACSALLIKNAIAANSHSGVMVMMDKHFVKEGKLPVEMGKLMRKVFTIRQESDYDDFIDMDKEDLAPLLTPVTELIARIESLIGLVG